MAYRILGYKYDKKCVLLEDMDSGRTITNDAENVYEIMTKAYGDGVRVVYLDTNKEWWEILAPQTKGGLVGFKGLKGSDDL